jgi:predicted nucleic acid-binding protein
MVLSVHQAFQRRNRRGFERRGMRAGQRSQQSLGVGRRAQQVSSLLKAGQFVVHPAMSYTDCYLAEEARVTGSEPLLTFDQKLAKQHRSAQLVTTKR